MIDDAAKHIKRDIIGETVMTIGAERGGPVPHDQRLYERALEIACQRLADAAAERPFPDNRRALFGLTPLQRKALDFITAYTDQHDCSPCYREIGNALGVKSASGIVRLVYGLRKRGRIDLVPRAKRSIIVLDGGVR